MVTEIATSEWRAIVERALEFAMAAPWQWMSDSQVVGIQHPGRDERAYCSIMGREGDFKALAVYPGKAGWWSYHQLAMAATDADAAEVALQQTCILVCFEQPQDADSDDRALLRHLGWDPERMPLVPAFRSYRPGYAPDVPDADEIGWLKLAIPATLALAQSAMAGGVHIPEEGEDKEGKLLFAVQDVEGWNFRWQSPDPKADFSPPQAVLAPDEELAGRALPQGGSIWLMDAFPIHQSLDDEDGGRPFYPTALVFFDVEEQVMRGLAFLHPSQWPGAAATVLLDLLMGHGSRPEQLVVSRTDQMILMRPWCKSLGIGIHLEKEMDLRAELREAVTEAMGPMT